MSLPLRPTRIAALAVPLRNPAAASQSSSQPAAAHRRRGRRLPPSSGQDDGLTLEHFLLRTRFLALYRSIVRATRDIPNPDARRDTLAWYRSDLFPPALRLERDLVNLKDALAQGYRQLKQIQGQFALLGAGGIRTQNPPGAHSAGGTMADSRIADPAGYVSFLDLLLERPVADRLVLDLRPHSDFAAKHIQNATHLPGGWAELNSRFSTYLPPRGAPFLVLCVEADEADVRRNLGERDGIIGLVVCRAQDSSATPGAPKAPSTAEDALLDPLGASEASFWDAAQRAGVLRSSTAASNSNSGSASGSGSDGPFSSPAGAKRGAHTLAHTSASQRSGIAPPFRRPADDIPHLMGQPSPALARMYESHIRTALQRGRGAVAARALDLGCGAGRDLAWLAYRGHMDRAHGEGSQNPPGSLLSTSTSTSTELIWRVTGLDNVRPVLRRAEHLMDAYDLMLQPAPLPSNSGAEQTQAGCEALLWGQVSPSGTLLALRTSGAGGGAEDTGGRNGKPYRLDPSPAPGLAAHASELGTDGVLLPQGAAAYALALPHGATATAITNTNTDTDAAAHGASEFVQAAADDPFDLVILVRFLPRTLLWDRPETMHALVRGSSSNRRQLQATTGTNGTGTGTGTGRTGGGGGGGFVLISHFVVPEESVATELPPTQTADRPALRRVYDAPQPSGRLQAGEIRRLVASWNEWAARRRRTAGEIISEDGQQKEEEEEEEEWSIVEDVIEPIEDGRAVQSVLIQRR